MAIFLEDLLLPVEPIQLHDEIEALGHDVGIMECISVFWLGRRLSTTKSTAGPSVQWTVPSCLQRADSGQVVEGLGAGGMPVHDGDQAFHHRPGV
jgi:hypothetical protein